MTAVDYTVDGQTYEGYFLAPEGKTNLPVVAIAHAWRALARTKSRKQAVSPMNLAMPHSPWTFTEKASAAPPSKKTRP